MENQLYEGIVLNGMTSIGGKITYQGIHGPCHDL